MKNKAVLLVVDFILLVFYVGLDQLTKYMAVLFLKNKPAIPIIENVLELHYLENKGAAFGMLQNQKIFFIFIAFIILFAIASLVSIGTLRMIYHYYDKLSGIYALVILH